MAISFTLRANATATGSATSRSTASFSPTGGRLLIAVFGCGRNSGGGDPGTVTVTDSFTGTGAWSSAQITATAWRVTVAWARLGATPGAGTVTFTPTLTTCDRWVWQVYDVDGVDTTTPVAQSATNDTTSTGTYSISLGSVPNAANAVFAGVCMRGDGNGTLTAGGTFTAQNDFNGTGTGGILLNSEYDDGSPPQSASWSDVGAAVTEIAAAILELTAAPVTGKPTHFMHYQKMGAA